MLTPTTLNPQIDPLEREAMIVKDMYELVDQFEVPTPPEDFVIYQVSVMVRDRYAFHICTLDTDYVNECMI